MHTTCVSTKLRNNLRSAADVKIQRQPQAAARVMHYSTQQAARDTEYKPAVAVKLPVKKTVFC
jgi:hypothetical protein